MFLCVDQNSGTTLIETLNSDLTKRIQLFSYKQLIHTHVHSTLDMVEFWYLKKNPYQKILVAQK